VFAGVHLGRGAPAYLAKLNPALAAARTSSNECLRFESCPINQVAVCANGKCALGSSTGYDAGTSRALDAAACTVLASDFDNSCVTSDDCVGVPWGGDICDPCHTYNPEGNLFCDFAALSPAGAKAFHAILDPAITAAIKADPDCDEIGVVNGSCPNGQPPVCVRGKCYGTYYDAGIDFDDGGAVTDSGADARD
jgi:hypothetical protein